MQGSEGVSSLESKMKKTSVAVEPSFDIVTKTAHELRSPLVAIAGYLSLVEENGVRLDVAQKKYLYRAIESTRKSLLLIDCLLDIESVGRRGPALKLTSLRLDQILRSQLHELEPKFTEAGISIAQERSYRLPPVLASKSHLASVFRHTLSYILDYTKRGKLLIHFRNRDGKLIVKLTVDSVMPAASERGGTVQLSARDIELYIAQYLLRLMGGDLSAKAFPAHSSTFYLSIPLARQLKLSV